jgi:uncharacterized membrane protein YeaQ/YmgE (transglycosylase-associated protein family)
MILFIISLLIGGLIVGALGRLLIPGRDPMSVPMTIGVGIGATLIAGLIGRAVFHARGGSFLFAVVVAMAIVYLIRRSRAGAGGGVGRPAMRGRRF